jgi:hypothetical protein
MTCSTSATQYPNAVSPALLSLINVQQFTGLPVDFPHVQTIRQLSAYGYEGRCVLQDLGVALLVSEHVARWVNKFAASVSRSGVRVFSRPAKLCQIIV